MAKKKLASTVKSQLRIIGGQWRGRKLSIVDVNGLRPTGDRIRETLFNWLQADIYGSRCLDMFAGTGALGLEALSRGAQSTIYVEQNAVAFSRLKEHLHLFDADAAQFQIIQDDVVAWLESNPTQTACVDIAFIDPPFTENLWQITIDALEQSQYLSNPAWIYLEMPKQQTVVLPATWKIHREKSTGDIRVCLALRHGSNR